MLLQSHVANGNYEVMTVLPHLLNAFLKFDNRSVFSQEVLNTLNYIWNPANNSKSEKLITLKKQFAEFNIGIFFIFFVFLSFLLFSFMQ